MTSNCLLTQLLSRLTTKAQKPLELLVAGYSQSEIHASACQHPRHHLNVHAVSNGLLALEAFNPQYDLVILRSSMKQLTGVQVAQILSEFDLLGRVPVILL